MRKVVGLIGLGVAGGTIPAGWAGFGHAALVISGAVGALVLLVTVCLAAPALARRYRRLSAERETRAPGVVARTPAAHI